MKRKIFNGVTFEDNGHADNSGMIIEKSSEFMEVVQETSDYLRTLPFSNNQYDHLCKLLLKQLEIRAQEAYRQGFKMGIELERCMGNSQKKPLLTLVK